MSLYRRGDIWYYDFWFRSQRHRASTGQIVKSDALQHEREIRRRADASGQSLVARGDRMSSEHDDRDSSLVLSRRLLPAKARLVTRGSELAAALLADKRAHISNVGAADRLTDAQHYLYQAWMQFADGCALTAETDMLELLVDAFDLGVTAAVSLGVERDEFYPEKSLLSVAPGNAHVARQITRMSTVVASDDNSFLRHATQIAQGSRHLRR